MNPSQRIPGHRFLHSPGPTRAPDEVVAAMSRRAVPKANTAVRSTEVA